MGIRLTISEASSEQTANQEQTMKHQICRTVLAAAAVSVGMFLSACGLFHDPADNVFDEAEDAIATDGAASKIKTAQIEYEFGDGKTSTVRFHAPGDVRIDVLDGGNSAVFCVNDGESGWMYVGGEVIDMTEDDIKEMYGALLQTIPFKVDFQEIFTNAELLKETEDVCGEECKVIKAVAREDRRIKVKFWIGKDTGLLRQFEINNEDGVYTMQYFDYATFDDDVTLPTEMFRFTPDGAVKLSLVSYETNIEIPEYIFLKPEKVSFTEGD
jgi:outer membrane lipoprotein-sorting protein